MIDDLPKTPRRKVFVGEYRRRRPDCGGADPLVASKRDHLVCTARGRPVCDELVDLVGPAAPTRFVPQCRVGGQVPDVRSSRRTRARCRRRAPPAPPIRRTRRRGRHPAGSRPARGFRRGASRLRCANTPGPLRRRRSAPPRPSSTRRVAPCPSGRRSPARRSRRTPRAARRVGRTRRAGSAVARRQRPSSTPCRSPAPWSARSRLGHATGRRGRTRASAPSSPSD